MYKLFSALNNIQVLETNSLTLAMIHAREFAVSLHVRTKILTPSGRTITYSKQGKLE